MYTLSSPLQKALQELLQERSINALLPHTHSIHEKYTNLGGSKKLSHEETIAYCLYRLPATYAALKFLCSKIDERGIPFHPTSLLDIGCGPGTAYFAMKELYPGLNEAFCVDHNEHFLSLFRNLVERAGYPVPTLLRQESQQLCLPEQRWEVGVLSYVLNELSEDAQSVLLKQCLDHCSYLFLIEPGTPEGFQTILRVRNQALKKGFSVLAPCPHGMECPMQQKKTWCHVRFRLERPSFQRTLKGASLNYEDEAISYLILHKGDNASDPRVVDHPQKRKGHVHLSLCQPNGVLEKRVVSKREQELYERAKAVSWGDLFS